VCAIPTSYRSYFVTPPLNPGVIRKTKRLHWEELSVSPSTNNLTGLGVQAIQPSLLCPSTGIVTAILPQNFHPLVHTIHAVEAVSFCALGQLRSAHHLFAGTLSGLKELCCSRDNLRLFIYKLGGIGHLEMASIATVNSTSGVCKLGCIAPGTVTLTYTVFGYRRMSRCNCHQISHVTALQMLEL